MKKLYSLLVPFGAITVLGASPVKYHLFKDAFNEDKHVALSTIEAWKMNGAYDIASEYVADGARARVPGSDTVGTDAWWHKPYVPNESGVAQAFSLDAYGKLTLEFSVGYFADDGTQISKSNNSDAIDIFFYTDADHSNQIGGLRIWTGSGGALNGNHSNCVYTTGWNDVADGKWIMGNATLSSHFFIQLDKENFLSSYVGGSDDITPLAQASAVEERKTALANVDQVYVAFAGDNGFTNSTDIVIRSVNGQSLANDGTYFTDTVAPAFKSAVVAETVSAGEEYEIPTTAVDLLSSVTYKVAVDGGEQVDGKKVTLSAGTHTVTLYAYDSVGNVSSKDYTIKAESSITPPSFVTVPTISSMSVEALTSVLFDMPTVEDSTGAGTVELRISKDGEVVTTLQPNANNKFELPIMANFTTGDYTFVYVATNSAGSTESNAQTATLTLQELNRCEFVSCGNDSLALYGEKGVELKTIGNWVNFNFGTFNITEGFDFKFIVDDPEMDNTAVSLHITNTDNPDYQAEYRVWSKATGADSPTNVYISTDGWANVTDITDTGWIKRTVDDVEGQYHMAFTTEDTFMGERLGGMQRVDNAYQQLKTFFEAAPSYNYSMALSLGQWGEVKMNAKLSEIQGQKLAAPITWNDAHVAILSEVPEAIAVGETLDIVGYAKDLRQACTMDLTVTGPDGTDTVPFVGNNVSYTFNKVGTYELAVSTVGANGNKVEVKKTVVCKSSTEEVTMTFDTEYQAQYAIGDEVTVITPTYSDNVVTKTIKVTEPNGNEKDVNGGDKYTFAFPGLYKITYVAEDDAQPVHNRAERVFTINVPDTVKPVIKVTAPETSIVNQEVSMTIDVEDSSEVTTTVTLTKPDSTNVKLTSSTNVFKFTPDAVGTYTVKVAAEDLYGNSDTKTVTITVNEAPKSDVNVPVIVAASVGGAAVVGGAAAAIILVSKKKKIK